MAIVLPPHLRVKLATENLVKAVLAAINDAGDEGYPIARLRDRFQIMGVPVTLAEHVENRLVRESIVTLKGDRLYMGDLANLRTFLARSKWDESRVVAIAPEKPRGAA